MRSFYSEYVQHCMKFYARHPHVSKFRSEADKNNWYACNSVMQHLPEAEREILLAVYRERDTIGDNVYKVAKERKINQDIIWKLITDLEHKIAHRRGLI